MAKRLAVQLQAELQTDDEFDKFLELPGLLVIDVYTEWCGPCSGMVNALRKVKLEQGGDSLNLAIARADSISYMQRFRKKSEPTWLFITEGKVVNIMFGADCPKLIQLILEEIRSLGKARQTYNITEMLPSEVKRDNLKNAKKRAKLQQELDEKERKKSDYLHFVTDTIHENLPDVGITIFGPQLNRDAFRHLIDHGTEKFGIVCKDRRVKPITQEEFDIINHFCKNPLPPDVLEVIDGKELYICFWKVSEELHESVADKLQKYADDIIKPHKLPPDDYRAEEQVMPPLVRAARVQVEFELPAGEECPVFEEPEPHKELKKHRQKTTEAEAARDAAQEEANDDEEDFDNDENEGEGPVEEPKQETTMIDFDLGLDNDADLSEGEEEEEIINDMPKKNICVKTVIVPAVWVPKDWRTHAAVIYVIFRGQTNGFLPPDPVPEPPHVIMAFDTYKKKDLIDFAERNKDDIPLYGFFTSDEAEEAKFIANNKFSYQQKTPAASDKLIFKVNKRTSHTMLSLATYGPTYVSPNTAVGADEAKIFFPDDYISAEQEMLEALTKKETETKGKVKHKGGKQVAEESSLQRLQAEVEAKAKLAEEEAALELERMQTEEGLAASEAQDGGVIVDVGEQTTEAGTEGELLEGGDLGEVVEAIELPTNIEIQDIPTEPTTAAPNDEQPTSAQPASETVAETTVADTAE